MGGRERELLLDAFDSGWIAPGGPHVRAFEEEFIEKLDCGHAVSLSSGTAALHLALEMLGVGPGDEVLVSSLTFASSVFAIRYVGATPVFVDSDPSTWTLAPGLLENHFGRSGAKPAALIAVDVYGQCADYDPLRELCLRHGIPLIEDASQALGARYRDAAAGTLGDLGAFSFNGNKIITTGGGGMLVSRRREWIERARKLASNSRDTAPHYEHSSIGYNYALSNLPAALGRAQLRALDDQVARRRANNAGYRDRLADVEGISFMPEASYGVSTHWLTAILIDPAVFGADREAVRSHLASRGIESRPLLKPMHLQPVFAELPALGGEVSEGLFAAGLCLPSGSNLDSGQLDRVCDTLLEARGRRLANEGADA